MFSFPIPRSCSSVAAISTEPSILCEKSNNSPAFHLVHTCFLLSHRSLCPRGYAGYPLSSLPPPEMFQLTSLEEQCQPDNPHKRKPLWLCQRKQHRAHLVWKFPFIFLLMISNTKTTTLYFKLKKKRDLLMKFGKKHLCCSLVGQEVLSYNQA